MRISLPCSDVGFCIHINSAGIGIWGRTARSLCGLSQAPDQPSRSSAPWKNDSLFEQTLRDLQVWLSSLNNKLKWGASNLLAYKASGLDLVRLSRPRALSHIDKRFSD